MGVIKRLLLILSIISICLSIKVECQQPQQQQKAQFTRTALHVARSLDPEAMETLTVKTKTGDVATLLVKKREGRHHHPDHQNHHENNKNSTNSPDMSVEMIPIASSSSSIYESISKEEHNKTENLERTAKKVPDPVFIRSDTVLVKGHQNDLFNNKRARNLLKLDSDGIPVVTGVRMPDDESDKQVWRNARVINGVLMPYDKTQPKHTFNIRSNYTSQLLNHEHNKKKVQSVHLNQGSWVKTDESAHKSTDKPKPNRETVQQTSQTTSSSSSPLSSTLGTQWTPPNLPSPQDVVAIVGAPIIQEWHQYPQEVVKVIDEAQPVLKEEDKYLRDKILEYIKNVNKQEVSRNQNVRQAFRNAKMIDYPIEIESRVLPQPIPLSNVDHPIEIDNTRNFEQQFHERDAKNLGFSTIGVQESRLLNEPIEIQSRNNYGHQSPIVEMDMRNSPIEAQPLRMESRMLQTPGESVYPESLLYSPQGTQPSSRLSVEEGVRTPVLQYAHPELGVQPADIESRFRGIDDGLLDNGREQAIAYFSHDIHADRSPFAFEPGMEEEETKVNENSQRSHGDTPAVNPKKISSQFHASQSVNGDSAPNKYYGKYENYYPANNPYQQQYSRPFWERIGDSIREHVQTGMDRMSEMTRPVVEPLVEATHKISHNLGLGSNRELATFKEKLGVANNPSVILPALGLVAGGAALGLGAVAVGRYLDVDMLKRSGGVAERIGEDQLEMEHKRAMSGIVGLPIGYQDETFSSLSPPLVNLTNPSNSSDVKATPTQPIEITTVEEMSEKSSETNQRKRRDLLQNVDEINPSSSMTSTGNINGLSSSTLWSNTPCAKKTFCNAMLSQTGDDVIVMEKKMATYLAMLNPASRAAIGLHLDDVMKAVNNRDCSAFHCRHDISDIPVPR